MSVAIIKTNNFKKKEEGEKTGTRAKAYFDGSLESSTSCLGRK